MSWQPALLWPSHIYRNQLQEIKSLGWLLSFYAFTDLAVTMEAKIRCSKPEPFFFFFLACVLIALLMPLLLQCTRIQVLHKGCNVQEAVQTQNKENTSLLMHLQCTCKSSGDRQMDTEMDTYRE